MAINGFEFIGLEADCSLIERSGGRFYKNQDYEIYREAYIFVYDIKDKILARFDTSKLLNDMQEIEKLIKIYEYHKGQNFQP